MELSWAPGAADLPPGQSPYAHDWLARAARRDARGAQDPAEAARCGTVALGLALDTGFGSGLDTGLDAGPETGLDTGPDTGPEPSSKTGLDALIGRALGP